MDAPLNEQRVLEVEVPLFQIEQKLERLEQ